MRLANHLSFFVFLAICHCAPSIAGEFLVSNPN
jgi:hypothetical protein